MKRIVPILVCVVLGLALLNSCKKDPVVPTLTTSDVINITINSATSGGSITNSGRADVTARGLCWGTSENPTISDLHTTDGTGVGSFVSNMADLTPNTVYHVRAYATNKAGTAYGTDISFTTTPLLAPSLTTSAVTLITLTTAVTGGNITSDGGGAVTARGVCWAITANPTVSSSKTSDQAGIGSFISNLTGLLPGTLYHIRAYATNTVGTSYGNDITFTTVAVGLPVLTTASITSITQTTAISGGNITSDGGASVTVRGTCWATTTSPTLSNFKTSDNTGTGIFASNLTGLTPGTTYYVRAYATNSIGTAYGNEISFAATSVSLPTLTTAPMSSITATTAVSGGNVLTNGGGTVTGRGVCWSLTTGPTITSFNTSNASGTGAFVSNLTGLTPGTTYYLRAYAVNGAGPAYGTEISFTTLAVLPTVTTTTVTSITTTTASSGGNISSNGNGAITDRGVCYSTLINPTTVDPKVSSGTGSGAFTSNLTGLTSGVLYHIRAYATNSAGTAYGSDLTFTTASLPTVSTALVTAITDVTATSGGSITSTGNATITAKGVCWSTSPSNTSLANSTNDAGTGTFVSNITALVTGTTYYVRAYATNIAGTAFGTEYPINTKIKDFDGNLYGWVLIGSQRWMSENLKTTSYLNGNPIGTTLSPTTDISAELTPKYQWPATGSEGSVATYGRLYTWYAVTDIRKVCPAGWSVPTDAQLEALKATAGGETVTGGKLKETGLVHWTTPNTDATNDYGFTALPSGYRQPTGPFVSLGLSFYIWSSEVDPYPVVPSGWGQGAHHNDAVLLRGGFPASDGVSVRCLKD